jgi:hypothetical protein
MIRRGLSTAAATMIAATLAAVATASAGTPPKALTHDFPLGNQALCCQTHTATATPQHVVTVRVRPSAPKQNRPANAPANRTTHSGHHAPRAWILIALAVALLVLVACAGWRVRGWSPRRPRRSADGHHPALRYEDETNDDSITSTPSPTDPSTPTPDPFAAPSPRPANRGRPRRDDQPPTTPYRREPPPLVIRRRPDD